MKTVTAPLHMARLCRQASRPLAFVPTMGALHAGHLALVQRARQLAGQQGTVVVSIFVNPTQFGPREDYATYPRPVARDRTLCRQAGVDLLFLPQPADMYAADHSTWVEEQTLSSGLCGRVRPGHFRGVCTIVAKLFHLVAPDWAVFGEKDWQQLAIVRRMTRDLAFPVRIAAVPTVREADGLALSSRNARLTPKQRATAPAIYRALREARARAAAHTPRELALLVRHRLAALPGARVDYVEAVDAETLGAVTPATRRVLLAVAVFLGTTRLIDHILLP